MIAIELGNEGKDGHRQKYSGFSAPRKIEVSGQSILDVISFPKEDRERPPTGDHPSEPRETKQAHDLSANAAQIGGELLEDVKGITERLQKIGASRGRAGTSPLPPTLRAALERLRDLIQAILDAEPGQSPDLLLPALGDASLAAGVAEDEAEVDAADEERAGLWGWIRSTLKWVPKKLWNMITSTFKPKELTIAGELSDGPIGIGKATVTITFGKNPAG